MLANALRETRAHNYISLIKTHGDVLVSSSQAIAQAFRDYYASLYHLEGQSSSSISHSRWETAREYLQVSGLPTLSDKIVKELDTSFTA